MKATVKICSLREVEHARWVVDSGADFFGLIFAPARRQVTAQRAADIIAAVEAASTDQAPVPVGVFVDENVVVLNNLVESLGLCVVQLHGDESPGYANQISTPILKAIKPRFDDSFDLLAKKLDGFLTARRGATSFLVEGFHPDHAGGGGAVADWETARKLAERFPVVLAGGLTPENVEAAIEAVRPQGVDVSSGVETDGVKDQVKIAEFVKRARAAYVKGNQ
jgi:phosphoribosylanthranilate isomerase